MEISLCSPQRNNAGAPRRAVHLDIESREVINLSAGGVRMNRSEGVQDKDARLRTRILFWFVKRKIGRVPPGMRVWAFDPKYLNAAVRMNVYGARRGVVPMTLKELAQLKVAMMVGCPF